jgi:hypothetical protein
MSELMSMFMGALVKSNTLKVSMVLGIVALLGLRVVLALRVKGAPRKAAGVGAGFGRH